MNYNYHKTLKVFSMNLGFTFFFLVLFWMSTVKAQNTLPKEIQDADFNYLVKLGGKCKKLIVNKQDFTQLCKDFFWQMSVKNRLIVVAIFSDNDNILLQLSFSGSQFQQPRLNRATLFLDYSRLYEDAKIIGESDVVGTCEMYGDVTKEVTKHICVSQDRENNEVIFEFSSSPNQVEVFN